MKTIKILLNYKGQTDSETLSNVYAVTPVAFRNANTISKLFKNAINVLRGSVVYECEFANHLLIFSKDEKILNEYNATDLTNFCETCGKEMDETEHNYGTEDIFTCLFCYDEAQKSNIDLKLIQ